MTFRLVARSVWANPGNRGKRFRKTLDAVGWQFHKRVMRAAKTIVLPNGRKFIAHPDCVVSSGLVYADWPEYRELMFVRENISSGSMMIDVGAYVGHIGLLLSDLIDPADIIAFEPSPIAFARLTENWWANGWDTGNLFQAAVGRHAGTGFVPNLSTPNTTNTVGVIATADAAHAVPLKRLDDLRDLWHGRAIGFLKIDVEGGELDVFLGAADLLKEDRPRMIMFESLTGGLDPDIRHQLELARYQIFQLADNGEPVFSRHDAQNLFAVPHELDELLRRVATKQRL